MLVKILVPLPSSAKTDPPAKVTLAVAKDAVLALKVIVIIIPAAPVNPGLGFPPAKVIVPRVLENAGSWTQRVKIEPAFETLIASNLSVLKDRVPSEVLIAVPPVFNFIWTGKVFPTV